MVQAKATPEASPKQHAVASPKIHGLRRPDAGMIETPLIQSSWQMGAGVVEV